MAAAAVATTAAAVLILAFAWWVVSLRPFSGGATAAVLAAGVAAAGVGARRQRLERPDRHGPASATAGAGATATAPASAWAAFATVTAAWQLAAYLQHPRHDHPTLSSLVNAVLDSHPARAVAFVVWLAGAAALGRRR